MAANTEQKRQENPVTPFVLVGYTLRCWPQSHFYSTNLVEILGEYNVSIFEAKRALAKLRVQGYLEYCHKPPGLWRIRQAVRNIKVPQDHQQIFEALKEATKANIDARLAGAEAPKAKRSQVPSDVDYYHVAAAALQIWPCNHFESTQLADYCSQFLPRTNYKSYRNRDCLQKLAKDGRVWMSPVYSRLFRITSRGRIGALGPRGPEILSTLRTSPPEAAPPGKDYIIAFALEHTSEWQVAELMEWLTLKEGALVRHQSMDFLKRLEKRGLVEQMKKGKGPYRPSVFRTRPALYEVAAPDLTLYEQLLHPEGRQLAERCYPEGRPEDLKQIGKVAPELADEATVAAAVVPAEQGLTPAEAPSAARIVSLKGVPLEHAPAPVVQLARGELSNADIVAGLMDYISELRAGAGVTEVARLRRKVDNLNGALQKTRGQNTSQATTIKKLNAIKANLEAQIKELSSQLAASNNRLQAAKQSQRPPVRSYGDKGTGFGLGEVARFKGRPLNAGPVIEKKRVRG